MLFLLFFRHLKITLDSEQLMLKEEQIIPSVWGGIKRFEYFQRGEYFSDNCAFELWVDFVSSAVSASQFAFRRAELKPACILLLVVKITFFTCPDFLIYLHVAEPALSLSSAKEPYC